MRKVIFLLVSFFAAFTVGSSSIANQSDELFTDTLRETVIYAQTNRWKLGADLWTENIVELEKSKDTDPIDLGFSYVLLTLFSEKNDDANAYDTWTKSLGIFLNNGSTWEQYRGQLATEIETLSYQIGSSFSVDGVSATGVSKNALILQSIDDLLSFTSYEGPRPGLSVPKDDEENTVTVSRTYFPRPNADLENQESFVNRSRTAVAGGSGQSDEQARVSRSIIPVAETGVENESNTASVGEDDDVFDGDIPILDAMPSIGVEEDRLVDVDTLDQEEKIPPLSVSRRIYQNESAITKSDMEIARRAWQYFIPNRQSNTGLINSVNKYPFTTVWDLGSSLAAIYCAHYLGLIDDNTFDVYIKTFLSTVRDFPLYDGALPNREYDTRSGLMTDLYNSVDDKGSGFSSLDIGRALIWLFIIKENHPEFSDDIDDVVAKWNLDRAITDNRFHREILRGSIVDRKQEGRFGYEQYAALGFSLWGVELPGIFSDSELIPTDVSGIQLLRDNREPDFLNLEPFLMIMLEFSAQPRNVIEQLDGLIAAHIQHAKDIGHTVLFTEDSIDEAPWFLYNIISGKEGTWYCKTGSDKIAEYCQTLSSKGAFAANAIFDVEYLEEAQTLVENNYDARLGYYAGIYEDGETNQALTVNTNAMILEAIAYKKLGRAFVDATSMSFESASRSRISN